MTKNKNLEDFLPNKDSSYYKKIGNYNNTNKEITEDDIILAQVSQDEHTRMSNSGTMNKK